MGSIRQAALAFLGGSGSGLGLKSKIHFLIVGDTDIFLAFHISGAKVVWATAYRVLGDDEYLARDSGRYTSSTQSRCNTIRDDRI